jgi:hypothetical protein
MFRTQFNIIRRFSHSNKPNSEIDYAAWHKSEDFKVRIDNMSNKIDIICHRTETIAIIAIGGFLGNTIGLMTPIISGIFK